MCKSKEICGLSAWKGKFANLPINLETQGGWKVRHSIISNGPSSSDNERPAYTFEPCPLMRARLHFEPTFAKAHLFFQTDQARFDRDVRRAPRSPVLPPLPMAAHLHKPKQFQPPMLVKAEERTPIKHDHLLQKLLDNKAYQSTPDNLAAKP